MLSREEINSKIPKYVKDTAEELFKHGYEAYLVGGSIRDILMGKTPNDFDIATNAYPDDISKIFPKSIPTGAKFGTITVVVEDENGERFDIEVTTYRSEEDYVGGRWPAKVEFAKTIEEDLSRRDFTINAMALEMKTLDMRHQISDDKSPITNHKSLSIIDPFKGLQDLENKVIRAVRDPYERFEEDGLRAVRGCRLASQLNFEIEEKTFKAMKETNHVTKMVSIERFRDEFMKVLLKSPKPSKGLRLFKDTGILALFIPELLEGIDIVQPEFHSDDVFEHSLKTCDAAEDSIKVAALFHDIGKPRTRTIDEKGIHFYGHDVVGAEMTKEIMKRMKFSNIEIERTVNLIRWHMFYYPSADWRKENDMAASLRPLATENERDKKKEASDGKREMVSEEKPPITNHQSQSGSKLKTQNSKLDLGWSDSAVRRLIKNVGGEDEIDDLMKLRIADATSNGKNNFNPKELDALAERIADVRAKEMALKVSDLDISGHDLQENLGIQPGPAMGEVLNYLLDKVIEDPLFNKKMDLLRLAKEFVEGRG